MSLRNKTIKAIGDVRIYKLAISIINTIIHKCFANSKNILKTLSFI